MGQGPHATSGLHFFALARKGLMTLVFPVFSGCPNATFCMDMPDPEQAKQRPRVQYTSDHGDRGLSRPEDEISIMEISTILLNGVDQARRMGYADFRDLSSAWDQTLTDVGPLARRTFWRSAR